MQDLIDVQIDLLGILHIQREHVEVVAPPEPASGTRRADLVREGQTSVIRAMRCVFQYGRGGREVAAVRIDADGLERDAARDGRVRLARRRAAVVQRVQAAAVGVRVVVARQVQEAALGRPQVGVVRQRGRLQRAAGVVDDGEAQPRGALVVLVAEVPDRKIVELFATERNGDQSTVIPLARNLGMSSMDGSHTVAL